MGTLFTKSILIFTFLIQIISQPIAYQNFSTQKTNNETLAPNSLFEHSKSAFTRYIESQTYSIEQISLSQFCKSHPEYDENYFEYYEFSTFINSKNKKILIISNSGSLPFSEQEIEEIKRRILFMDNFSKILDKDYLDSYSAESISWPEYQGIPYSPFCSNITTNTHLYGFVHKPKKLALIAGCNFIEETGQFGKQTNPQPIFGSNYSFGGGGQSIQKQTLLKKDDAEKNPKLSSKANMVDRIVKEKFEGRKDVAILDIGCSSGYDLIALHHKGFTNLFGIDRDRTAIEKLQSIDEIQKQIVKIKAAHIGMDDKNLEGLLQENFGRKKFDVITLHMTIEHLQNPDEFLSLLSSLLNPGGILVLSGIPDEESLVAKLAPPSYGDYDKFTHYHFFTRQKVSSFSKYGFQVVFDPQAEAENTDGLKIIFEESLPYIIDGQWYIFGKQITKPLTEIFIPEALHYHLYKNFRRFPNDFSRYRLYEKNKRNINLLLTKFLIDANNDYTDLDVLISQLRNDLFDILVLDKKIEIPAEISNLSNQELIEYKINFQKKFGSLRTMWCYLVKSQPLVEQLETIRNKFKKEYSPTFGCSHREVKINNVYFTSDNPTLDTSVIIDATNGKFTYIRGHFESFQTTALLQVNSIVNELRKNIKTIAILPETFFENLEALYLRLISEEKDELDEYDIQKLRFFDFSV